MTRATFAYELKLWQEGFQRVVGLDEVGRGAWAGPVVAAAVVFPPYVDFPEPLFDSKLLTNRKRCRLAKAIEKHALSLGVATIDVSVINRVGVGRATQFAFRKALRLLGVQPDFYLIDAFYVKYLPRGKQKPIKKGDQCCASIAAASIVAKVYRDKLMRRLHFRFSQYGFGRHKGYGTQKHQRAITELGVLPIHRKNYSWIKTRLEQGLVREQNDQMEG